MINAVRTARAQSLFSSANIVARKPSGIRFASDSSVKMDPKQCPESKTRDSSISSLGEGYASRSDEDGFGGTCGGTKQAFKDEKNAHGKDTEFDHNQGSEVKEKEDARNQKNVQ